jgi:hypothetical protein
VSLDLRCDRIPDRAMGRPDRALAGEKSRSAVGHERVYGCQA